MAVAKNTVKNFCCLCFYFFFAVWTFGKKNQNEQTEQKQGKVLLLDTRSRMWIRREAKFVNSKKELIKGKNEVFSSLNKIVVSKNTVKNFCCLYFYFFFAVWTFGKKNQNEQTEQKQGKVLLLDTRSRMWIRREAKFVNSKKELIKGKNEVFSSLNKIVVSKNTVKNFCCLCFYFFFAVWTFLPFLH
ncbi:MAG: hypothetical protein E7399_04295 [Ruminococcaceae bacterium]|nr:hypothetical protein [Oscillospiraceae bacterium]